MTEFTETYPFMVEENQSWTRKGFVDQKSLTSEVFTIPIAISSSPQHSEIQCSTGGWAFTAYLNGSGSHTKALSEIGFLCNKNNRKEGEETEKGCLVSSENNNINRVLKFTSRPMKSRLNQIVSHGGPSNSWYFWNW